VPKNYTFRLSDTQKKELIRFMKNTMDKEEYRRASAAGKQKMEGLSYRIISRNVNVTYRNVYDWITNYRKYGLDGIRNKRMNAGRKPVISIDKNKEIVKDIVLNKSPKVFGYLKNTCSI
jgi:transposase